MSTRSTIAIQNRNGTVLGVYCHDDGYPSGVGRVLSEAYFRTSKVRELLKLGHLSKLAVECTKPDGHTWEYETRVPGYTVAYGRDRGDKDMEPYEAADYDTFRDTAEEAYNYLFIEGYWYVTTERYGEESRYERVPVEHFYYEGEWHDDVQS